MYASKSIEDILNQVNKTLPHHDRVSPEQIREVGHQLDCLLHDAEGPEYHTQATERFESHHCKGNVAIHIPSIVQIA